MNGYALIAGTLIAVFVISRIRTNNSKKPSALISFLLASFSIYYWAFALFGQDFFALKLEILIGVLFIAAAAWAYSLSGVYSLLILSTGYIGHGIYDATHNSIFVNAGTPVWWPEFCGAVDIIIGLYLLFLAAFVKSIIPLSHNNAP